MKEEQIGKTHYLGKAYPVYVIESDDVKGSVIFENERFIYKGEVNQSKINKSLKSFFTKACKKNIEKRIKFYQPNIKVKAKGFTIENDDRKWGSCNSDRQLTFHWKLIQYPQEAIDYVVVHELCHLMHLNHDRSFWRLLGKIMPHYKTAMAIIGAEKTNKM